MHPRDVTHRDRGANLVEFALIAPFLLLLLIGIIEFSFLFATNLDVKHGAREGARLTVVNEPSGGNADLTAEICSRMGIAGVDPTGITWTSDGTPAVGEGVQVTVSTNTFDTLTGFIDWVFPASLTSIDATVEMRIEQPPTWVDGEFICP